VKSIAADGLAEEVMGEIGVDLSKQPAKSVAQSFKQSFAYVVTLSDDSKERSPVWPFTRNVVHWNLPDPAAVDGPVEKKREAFRWIRDELRNRTTELAKKVNPVLKSRVHAA
jgi:arsenate reductase (thioredoxin)